MKEHIKTGAIVILLALFSLYIIASYFEADADETPWQVQATQRIEESRQTRLEARKLIEREVKISDCMKEKLTKVENSIDECLGL
jgi:hypothetical protein